MSDTIKNSTRTWVLVCFSLATGLVAATFYYDYMQDEKQHARTITLFERGATQQHSLKQLNVAFVTQISAMKDLLLRGKNSSLYHQQLSHYYETERTTRSYLNELISHLPPDDTLKKLARQMALDHRVLGKQFRETIKLFNTTDEQAHVLADRLLQDSDQAFHHSFTDLTESLNDYQQRTIWRIQQKEVDTHIRNMVIIILISLLLLAFLYAVLDRKIKALKNSEIRQHTILKSLSDALVTTDKYGRIEDANLAATEIFGYRKDELIGANINEILIQERTQTGGPLSEPEAPVPFPLLDNRYQEVTGQRKNGSQFDVEVKSSSMLLDGQMTIVNIMHDITLRKRSERTLLELLELNASIIRESPIGISICDQSGQCIEANNAIGKMVGATREQVLAQNYLELESWHKSGLLDAAKNCLVHQKTYRHEFDILTSFGKRAFFDCLLVPLTVHNGQGLLFMIDDVSERRLTEAQREQALAEKTTLLKEIHHRVKNNMQIISGLMYLQAQKTENAETLAFLQDSQRRINSMGLIHEQLYSTENLNSISFKDYIHTLIKSMQESIGSATTGISFKIEVENLQLPVDTAIPCGLIVNELITNSLKHAFNAGEPGTVVVRFAKESDTFSLAVHDNGVGLPTDYDWSSPQTLGLDLVRTLADQLDGELAFHNNNGCECRLSFTVDG